MNSNSENSIASNLALHNFKGSQINQTTEDTLINGVLIPKGFVNATEMCVANGKKLQKYFDNKTTKEFLTEYKRCNPNLGAIRIVPNGKEGYGGTYVSLDIALHLGTWVSPEFAVWAMRVLRHVVNKDFKALTAEALEAEQKLNSIWDKVRKAGIITRRSLTDAIKEWYSRNPNGTTRPIHAMYAVTTNAIYQALWSLDAKGLESILDCGRNESRDYLDSESLKVLDRAEARVMEFIDEDNIKPIDAVNLAGIRKSKTVPLKK
jgi:hypothetical protein